MNVMQLRARRARAAQRTLATNIYRVGGGVASVAPMNKGQNGRIPRGVIMRQRPAAMRNGNDWRIGAMTGTTGSAFALGAVLIGAFLLLHKG